MHHRSAIDEAVEGIAGVVGSMVGAKLVGGTPTEKFGVSFLVDEKIPSSDLPPHERLPSSIRIGGSVFGTDVVVWPKMKDQALENARLLFDQATQGALTCFAKSPFGMFGLSCAHCLCGADKNPATPTAVDMYSPTLHRLIAAGTSGAALVSPGQGTPADYGFVDCGLFRLEEASLSVRAARATPLSVVQNPTELEGTTLYGTSGLNVSADHARTAFVTGIHQVVNGRYSDLVLLVADPGTYGGDSGLLWRTADGRAAAIHTRGEIVAGGSRWTTAMMASRASRLLGVDLYADP